MTLGEVLERIRSFDEESFICVEGGEYPSPSSSAVVIPISEGSQTPAPPDMAHFVEVYRAVDVLAAWSQHRGGQTATALEMIDAIYYNRKHDAYLLPSAKPGGSQPGKILIPGLGVAAALIGCFTYFATDWILERFDVDVPLNDAGFGFVADALELIQRIGLVPMMLGGFVSGILVTTIVITRSTRRKRRAP